MFSPSQFIFFLTFFSLFFLLMVFGETQYGIFIVAIFTLLFVVYLKKLDLSILFSRDLRNFTAPLVAIILFSVLSLFVTQSIPLTMYRAVFFLFSFLCFVFFLSVDKNFLPTKMLVYGFCLIACVLAPLTLFFFFFPDFAKHLPDLNLLVANYGHNHAAIYFLFALPLTMCIWMENRHNRSSLIPFLCVVIGLFFSFARVVTFLTCIELICLFWLLTRRHLFSKKYWLFLVPFVVLLSLFTFFSVSSQFVKEDHCNLPIFQRQLCKPFASESRPEYWKQALAGIKAKPLTGWGGGTFSIISQKFQSDPYHFSTYPHNEYLEFFTDYGVVAGSIFLLFFFILVPNLLKIFVQKKLSDEFFLSVSIMSLCVDAFFDYNWNYISILSLFLIAVALVLKKKSQDGGTEILTRLTKIFLFFIVIAIGLWAGSYVLSTVVWVKGNKDLAMKIFPFADWRAEEVLSDENTNQHAQSFLLSLYQNNPTVIQKYLQNVSDSNTRIFWFQRIIALEPQEDFARYQLLHEYIQTRKWSQLISGWEELQAFCHSPHQSCSNETVLTAQNEMLATANKLLPADPQTAIQISLELYRTNPKLINPDQFIAYDFPRLKVVFQSHQWPELLQISQQLVSFADWEKWGVWKTLFPLYQAEFTHELETGDLSQTTRLLQSWNDISQIIHLNRGDSKIDFVYHSSVIHKLQNLANTEIRQQHWADAELTLQILSKNFGDDYWTVSQLGNFYYLRGDIQKATQAYQTCVAKYAQKETDCMWGLRSIQNNWNDGSDRYWSASAKLLEYNW